MYWTQKNPPPPVLTEAQFEKLTPAERLAHARRHEVRKPKPKQPDRFATSAHRAPTGQR